MWALEGEGGGDKAKLYVRLRLARCTAAWRVLYLQNPGVTDTDTDYFIISILIN